MAWKGFYHFGPGIYIYWVTRGVYFVFYCRGGAISICRKKRFVYSLLYLESMDGLLVFIVYIQFIARILLWKMGPYWSQAEVRGTKPCVESW